LKEPRGDPQEIMNTNPREDEAAPQFQVPPSSPALPDSLFGMGLAPAQPSPLPSVPEEAGETEEIVCDCRQCAIITEFFDNVDQADRDSLDFQKLDLRFILSDPYILSLLPSLGSFRHSDPFDIASGDPMYVSVKTGFLCSLLENVLARYATMQLARFNLV